MGISKERMQEFFRFCGVGGTGFAIDYSLLELLVYGGMSAPLARLLSIAITMQIMYFLHGRITYRNHAQRGLKPWLAFIATNLLGMCVNYGIFLGVLEISPLASAPLNRLVAIVSGTGVSLFFNYFMNRRFAFKSTQGHP